MPKPEKPFTSIRNARIMPLLGSMDAFTAGVFDGGKCLPDSLLYRGTPSPLYPIWDRLRGAYIFGGYLFMHFGHFLWESLSRLYALRRCAPLPVLFLSPNGEIYPSQKRLFALFGLKNELILLKSPTEVESLICSPPGSSLQPLFITDGQLEALASFPPPAGQGPEKIWLSRSSFYGGGVDNEAEIERELASLGWTVTFPERLSLAEQVRNISTARHVAGFDGSAFFSLLLARQSRAQFHVFDRRGGIPGTLPYVFDKKKVKYKLFAFPLEYRSGEGAARRHYLPEPERVIDALSRL